MACDFAELRGVCPHCVSKVKNPGGVRMNWWHLSPFMNVGHMSAPGFVAEVSGLSGEIMAK